MTAFLTLLATVHAYPLAVLATLTDHLTRGQPLDGAQIAEAVTALTSAEVAVEAKADFLSALTRKGETLEEIAGFATELRRRAVQPPLDAATRAREILDVCGTGGDYLGTFNISTGSPWRSTATAPSRQKPAVRT